MRANRWVFAVVCVCALALACSSGETTGNSGAGGNHAHAGAAGSLTAGGTGGTGNGGSAGTSPAGAAGRSAAGGANLPPLGDSAAEACVAYGVASCERAAVCAGRPSSGCIGVTYDCPDLVASPGSTRTAAALKACAETYKTYSCDLLGAGTLPPCVTPGTRKRGEQCVYPSQCESLNCEFSDTRCGACAIEAADGEDCSAPDVDCKHGSNCESGKCVRYRVDAPPKALGAPCMMGDACTNSICDGTTCKALPGVGASCMSTFSCAMDAFCDTNDFFCKKLPASGEQCLPGGGGSYRCAEGLVCHTQAQPDANTPFLCGPPPAIGEPCIYPPASTLPLYQGCGDNRRCDTTTSPPVCAAIATFGVACSETDDCAAGLFCFCASGTTDCQRICSTLRFAGESCDLTGNTCHPAFNCVAGKCVPSENRGVFASTCTASP